MGRSQGRNKRLLRGNNTRSVPRNAIGKSQVDADELIGVMLEEYTHTEEDLGDNQMFLDLVIRDIKNQKQTVPTKHPRERETGLAEKDDDWDFIRPDMVKLIKEHPEAADAAHVMVDLDSTIFPLDRAMRAVGIDTEITEQEHWGESGDTVGDAIMRHFGREDLLHGKDLTDEQLEEKIGILSNFFRELHEDEELMNQAGVFKYAPQMIEVMRRQGIKVHIITHRSPTAALSTIAWLDAMGVGYDYFECDEAGNLDKIKYCQDSGISIVFDDKPKTIIDAEAAGIEALSLKWPYSEKALADSDGDEAHCWQEMTHKALDHMERILEEVVAAKS